MDKIEVATDAQRTARLAELRAQDRDAEAAAARGRKNEGFVQVYKPGWNRLQTLIQQSPQAARVYAFLAEHIDGVCGTVVVSQKILAEELGVHFRTIRRQTLFLEEQGALVRIRIGAGVYAYCLNPNEVWRSWDTQKKHAAFVTRTLVSKKDRENGKVDRRLRLMFQGEAAGPNVMSD